MDKIPKHERDRVRRDLLDYCHAGDGQELLSRWRWSGTTVTLAMVRNYCHAGDGQVSRSRFALRLWAIEAARSVQYGLCALVLLVGGMASRRWRRCRSLVGNWWHVPPHRGWRTLRHLVFQRVRSLTLKRRR